MPGFLARLLTRFLGRFLTRVFGQGFWAEDTVYSTTGTEKYSFTVLSGRKHTVLQYYRDGEKRGKQPCITSPTLLNIPYTKNLAVVVNIYVVKLLPTKWIISFSSLTTSWLLFKVLSCWKRSWGLFRFLWHKFGRTGWRRVMTKHQKTSERRVGRIPAMFRPNPSSWCRVMSKRMKRTMIQKASTTLMWAYTILTACWMHLQGLQLVFTRSFDHFQCI